MDYNKGRFIPDVYPLSYFEQENARTPFEGEVCVNENTMDICFWKQNSMTNMWENICRTADFQKYLDDYENDTTFPAARAFIANEIIHRMFYNSDKLETWIDDTVNNEDYVYYAIKSIIKINGKQRYVTGTQPNDGLTNEFALFPIEERATMIFPINAGKWYSVEFYDSEKNLKSSINFISNPCKNMPIEKNLRESGSKVVDGNLIRDINSRVINFAVKFNQDAGENKAYLYIDQPIDDLEYSIIKKMPDGHICSTNTDVAAFSMTLSNSTNTPVLVSTYIDGIDTDIDGRVFIGWSLNGQTVATNEELHAAVVDSRSDLKIYALYESDEKIENRISISGFDKIDNSRVGSFQCYVNYTYIKTNNQAKKYKVCMYREFVADNNDVSVSVLGINSTRKIISVQVEQVGEASFVNVEDYSVSQTTDDVITIPREYFGFGNNNIKITYSEDIDAPLVPLNDLVIGIPVTVNVIEDHYLNIERFIPAGLITNPESGLYRISMRYFALYQGGIMEDVTSKVIPVKDVNPASFGISQSCSVKIQMDAVGKVFNTYNFSVYCTDPSIAGNNSRVIVNGIQASKGLYYDGSNFKLAKFNNDVLSMSSLNELLPELSKDGITPTHIRIREIDNSSKVYVGITNNENALTYIQKLCVPMFMYPCKDITLGEIFDELSDTSPTITDPKEYGMAGKQLFEYKSATRVGVSRPDDYIFQYFSINNGQSPVTAEDRNIVCQKDKLIYFDDANGRSYPMEVHTKNASIFSVSKDKPFLVEGYYKDENGKYICTGGVVHYAEPQT